MDDYAKTLCDLHLVVLRRTQFASSNTAIQSKCEREHYMLKNKLRSSLNEQVTRLVFCKTIILN